MSEFFPLKGRKVLVAGHRGMVGAAMARRLASEGCTIQTLGRDDADLTRQAETEAVLSELKPDAIVMAAAKVGGILANDRYPASFLYDNLAIEINLIEGARRAGIARIVMLGSSCIYPKHALQPIPESALLTGPLEPTNEWYAIAKIAGLKMAQAYRRQYGLSYISAMPTNLYGPHDNFDLNSSHVMPALIRKAHEAKLSGAKEIVMWGTGTPMREFLHVDDCADGIVHLLKTYDGEEHVNLGSGIDLSIAELMNIICEVVGFTGEIKKDLTKPDGTPRKLMSGDKIKSFGWQPKIALRDGIASTYKWFLENVAQR